MNIPVSSSSPHVSPSASGNGANVSFSYMAKAVTLLLRKWYLLLLSLAVFLSLAYLYAAHLPYAYEKTIPILVRNDYPNDSIAKTVLATRDGITKEASTNLGNEALLLSSYSLMEAVARHLTLDVSYWKRFGYRNLELYKRSPVEVVFSPEQAGGVEYFRIIPESGQTFRLERDLGKGKKEEKNAEFGKPVDFAGWKFTVEKTDAFSAWPSGTPVIVRKISVSQAASELKSGIAVKRPAGNADLINITARTANPDKAVDILNEVVRFYNRNSQEEKKKSATQADTFIAGRLQTIREEMEGNENIIDKIKRDTDILADLSTVIAEEYKNSIAVKKDLRDMELEIRAIEYLKEYLEKEVGNGEKLVPLNSKISDIGVKDQIGIFNETLLRRTSLKVNAGDNNPIVRELEANIHSLQDSLTRSVENYYSALLVKKKNAKEQYDETRKYIESVAEKERNADHITREKRVWETLYVFLLNKREENAMAVAAASDNARIVEAPRGSNSPIAPRTTKILFFGGLAGLAVPLFLALIVSMSYSRPRRKEEVESLTGLKVLGEIPSKPLRLKKREVVLDGGRGNELSESFPLLAGRLDALAAERSRKGAFRVLVTSTVPGEGKTYVALNLALTLAAAGRKVLLMDMDLREGGLSRYLEGGGKEGICDWVAAAGGKSWRSLVQPYSSSENLDLIFAGTLPDHPVRCLLNPALDHLIQELEEHYDYILMDCSAYSRLADAGIVARVADETLYVVRCGFMKRKDMEELNRIGKSGQLNHISIVLCDSEVSGKRSKRFRTMYKSLSGLSSSRSA